MTAFRNVYNKGGVRAFWAGFQPKMVESFLKGGILLFAKDAAMRSMKAAGATEVTAGLAGGFVGGCAQVVIMGPCTFLVTAAVTGDKSVSVYKHAVDTFKTRGIGGFYHGGTALLLRQGTFSCAQLATIIANFRNLQRREQLGFAAGVHRLRARSHKERQISIGRVLFRRKFGPLFA
jgi:hypothetical protein